MTPDERRQEILDVARRLFSEQPYTSLSTADIAEAAGVARSLVHHYIGGIREVFIAVVTQGAAALTDVRQAGPETPFEERTARNIAATLDVIGDNRETWLAVAGHGADPADPLLHSLVLAARERSVDQTLRVNSDILTDTPTARYALRCFAAFTAEVARGWLIGEATREEAEALLLTVGRDLIQRVIPALEDRPSGR
jgi:AcrR family transcriptional regulator